MEVDPWGCLCTPDYGRWAVQVRTLESSYALELAKRQTAALRRAVDTYSTASLFVSARDGGWSVMHMNDCALRLAGAADTLFPVRLLAGARPECVRATVAGTSSASVDILEFSRPTRMQGRASCWWAPSVWCTAVYVTAYDCCWCLTDS